jgi:hypothetical protein
MPVFVMDVIAFGETVGRGTLDLATAEDALNFEQQFNASGGPFRLHVWGGEAK